MTRIVCGAVLAVTLAFMPRPAPKPETVNLTAVRDAAQLARTERGTATLAAEVGATATRYVRDVYPIEAALLRDGRVRDPAQARAAAWALVLETETRHLSPRLLAEVMKKENPWLVPDTTSFAGAVGWMQVMPMHAVAGGPHREACGPGELTDGRTNVCYGADILRLYIGEALDEAIRKALLRYSGCVRTPGCEDYAEAVTRRFGNND